MAIVKMKKVSIIALQSEKEQLVKRLQKFGGLHVIDLEEWITEDQNKDLLIDSETDKVNQLEAELSQVKFSYDFISKYDKTKKKMFAQKIQVSEKDYYENLNEKQKTNDIYEQCRAIDTKFAELKNAETKINNLIQQLEPWKSLNTKLDSIKNTRNVNIMLGFILTKYVEEFKDAIYNSGAEVNIEEISTDKENTYILLMNHNSAEDKVSTVQKQFSWTKVAFNDLTGTAEENIARLRNESSSINVEKEELTKKAEKLVQYKEFLEILHDVLANERDKNAVVTNFAKTEKSFIIHGWVPEKQASALTAALQEITDRFWIQYEDPNEDEEFPVLLDNPVVVKPLEMITEQYSLPNSRAIDPNLIMTPFFVMFFGMMVSDAGYGIVLAISTAIALIVLKPQGGMGKMLGLLCLGGISTFIWGAMFGGWFGVNLRPLWFNPLDNPLKMLIFCLILGVIQLYVGIGLQAYKNIRAGKYLDAIFDQGLWYLFLSGLMMMALPQVAVIGKYMAIGGAIGLIATQGRSEKGIIKKLINGVLSLYNVTGFLGDVLSYSRLFALGLATGVIGTVVNAMSSMLGGSFFGNILMVFFMIFGHTFNIAINVLGAYVHSSRLQYVEFFGKFFEGDGKPFVPFRTLSKYTK
ncbi:MAG: archaeal/vacuolar-type H+-ATPase subunit [Clostridia bacterium]|jgi:V/A-type H+-transporting ATPase subunit I|nr:archaeal/vacuolar-type H+-ATPase subunit [Clostridia bacterium]